MAKKTPAGEGQKDRHRKPQLNVRLPDDVMASLPDLARRAGAVLGLPDVSIPDLLAMGLQLLGQWLDHREANRADEVAALAEPVPTGETPPRRGRPRTRTNGGAG